MAEEEVRAQRILARELRIRARLAVPAAATVLLPMVMTALVMTAVALGRRRVSYVAQSIAT